MDTHIKVKYKNCTMRMFACSDKTGAGGPTKPASCFKLLHKTQFYYFSSMYRYFIKFHILVVF